MNKKKEKYLNSYSTIRDAAERNHKNRSSRSEVMNGVINLSLHSFIKIVKCQCITRTLMAQ